MRPNQSDSFPPVSTALTGHVVLDDLSTRTTYPLVRVHLRSTIISGPVELAVKYDPFPIAGVHILLGNDLAGDRVGPNLKVVNIPLSFNPTQETDNPAPEIFPLCAVTRSKSKAKDHQPSSAPPTKTLSEDMYSKVMTKGELVEAQQTDPTLAKIKTCHC